MIECPNCGFENPTSRAFCAICGERLPQQAAAPDAPPPPVIQAEEGEPRGAEAPEAAAGERDVAGVEWLLGEGEPPPAGAAPDLQPPAQAGNTFLPAWLQGMAPEPEPVAVPSSDWTDALDFSGLPDWSPEPGPSSPPAQAVERARAPEPDRAPAFSTEVGAGLLAGVQGLLPQRPALQLRPGAVPFPQGPEPAPDGEAADLFARIAGGGVLPEAVVLPEAASRGASLSHLLLLLAVIVPLLLQLVPGVNAAIFSAPPPLRSAAAYAATVEALPAEGTVLLAFDYEGGMRDEVEPGVVATLNHLRALGTAMSASPRTLNLVAVSLSPQGSALAERVWAESASPTLTWTNLGFLPGGPIALRTLLAPAGTSLNDVSLLVVFGNETADVQRWIEQVGSQLPGLPILAVAPAAAETALMPYLASGQLDGLLAGVPGAASYEVNGSSQLGAGWRRIHAITAGALLVLGVIVAANLRAGRRERAS
jgi:hypothetical protein